MIIACRINIIFFYFSNTRFRKFTYSISRTQNNKKSSIIYEDQARLPQLPEAQRLSNGQKQ